MKNFGIISTEEANLMGDKYIGFLESKGLLNTIMSLGSTSSGNIDIDGTLKVSLSSNNMKKEFIPELGLELRDFLLTRYRGYIGGNLKLFKASFERETFGVDDSVKKGIGLKNFNQYYDACCDVQSDINNRGMEGFDVLRPRMSTLQIERRLIGEALRYELDMIGKYLAGNRAYFDKTLFEESQALKRIVSFENNYQILKYLNKKLEFEPSNEYDLQRLKSEKLAIDRCSHIYDKYPAKVQYRKVVEFIDWVFSNKEYRKRNYAMAFFECMSRDLYLIYFTSDEFCNLCNEYYQCNFADLKRGSVSEKAVRTREIFKSLWKDFIKE